MSKQDKNILLTPVGIADYPYLTKPDTKFKPEGEYKLTLKLDNGAEAEKLFSAVSRIAEIALEQATAAAKKAGKRPPKPAELPIFETDTGYTLKAKMKAAGVVKATGQPFTQAPRLFDADNRPWDKNVIITSGSKVRLCLEVVAYNSPTLGCGVTLRLKDAQIIELGAGFGGDSPFGAVPSAPSFGDDSGGVVWEGDDGDF